MEFQLVQQEAPIINETHPIIQCIISNNPNKLKLLLKKHDINGLYPCKEIDDVVSPLIAAVAFHKEGIFSFLLHEAADPNTCSSSGWTPLHFASFKKVPIFYVQKLLAAKADPNGTSNQFMTPLQAAAEKDRYDISKLLISKGAFLLNCNLKNPQRDAIMHKFSKMIHQLSSNGVKICSEVKHFVDLDIEIYGFSVERKSCEEVFKLFDHVMLHKHPQTHITVIDVVLSVTGPGKTEYQNKAIQWLRDNNKINQYIEEAVKHFPKRLKNVSPWLFRICILSFAL